MSLSQMFVRLLLIVLFAPLAGAQATRPVITRPAAPVDGWKSAVDPADLKGKPRLDLKLTTPIKNGVKSLVPSRPSPFIAIIDENVFGPSSWSLLNLNTGGVTPAFAAKLKLEGPMLSPDGQYLAGRMRAEGGQPSALEIWSMKQGKQLHRLLSGDTNWPPVPLGFAAGDQIVSVTHVQFKPKLQAWDLKTGNRVWEVDLPKMIETKNSALSPGGKFIAIVHENKLGLIETAKGETVAKLDLPEAAEKAPFGSQPKGVAFSPDGLELAAYCDHGGSARLLIWDLASGQVIADHLAEAAKDDRRNRAETKFEYFGDLHFLRYSENVIDRDSAKVVYAIPQSKKGRQDDLIMAIGDDRVLTISEKDQNKAWINIAMLPKADIEKSVAVVRTGGKASDANLPPLTKGDLSAVRVALDAGAPATWSLKVDAAKVLPAGGGAIALRPQHPASGDDVAIKTIAFSGAMGNQIAAGYHVNSKGVIKSVIDRISLAGGIAAGSFEFPNSVDLLDLSADGKTMLVKTGEDRLDLYSLATGAAKHVLGLRPYDGDKNGAAIKFAAIISPEQFLTVSQSGRLILWNVQGAKAVYEMATQRDGFAISPNRAQFAFVNGSGVTIIDTANGQVLASLVGPQSSIWTVELAFHPDGSRLAYFLHFPYPRLLAFDLSTGQTLADCALPKDVHPGGIYWADSTNILVGGSLVSLEQKTVVWRYQRDPFSPIFKGSPDNRWAFVSAANNQPPALLQVAIPHNEAKQAAAALKPAENIVVRPGTKVSIQVSVTGDADFPKKVTDALAQHAKDAGWVVADNADVHLVATTTAKAGKTMDYNVIGGNPARQTVTIPSYDCKLEINKDGQSLWEAYSAAGGMAPSFASNLKQGQTVQDLVDSINLNPGGGFYMGVTFPSLIAKPLEKVGASKITLKGIVPAQ